MGQSSPKPINNRKSAEMKGENTVISRVLFILFVKPSGDPHSKVPAALCKVPKFNLLNQDMSPYEKTV